MLSAFPPPPFFCYSFSIYILHRESILSYLIYIKGRSRSLSDVKVPLKMVFF